MWRISLILKQARVPIGFYGNICWTKPTQIKGRGEVIVFRFSTFNLGCTYLSFFSWWKDSSQHLRFASVIMAARTDEAINSPKSSSGAVTLKLPSQFEQFLEWWGTKTTSIPGILFTHLMRCMVSSTSWWTCDLGNYWRTCFPSPLLQFDLT